MMNVIFSRGGRVALMLGSMVIGYALATLQRADPLDFDPWATD